MFGGVYFGQPYFAGTPVLVSGGAVVPITVALAGRGTLSVALTTLPTAPPVNTIAPIITGVPVAGNLLSTTNGVWTDSPSFTYKWQRATTAGGVYADIPGATFTTYVLLPGDAGYFIRSRVTATNGGGSVAANSNIIGPVTLAPPPPPPSLPACEPGPLSFLEYSGVEIANAARTLSYLRRGLDTSGRWEFGAGDVCSVLYRLNGSCIPQSFIHPSVDPAPWYDPTEPGSSKFLGFVLLDIQGYDSTIIRSSATRLAGLGGSTLSAQYRGAREWKFRGAMISADASGAEFGLRWLTAVLGQTNCDQCGLGDITVRLVCPAGDCSDDSQGKWTSYEAALTAGPKEVEPWGPASHRLDSDVMSGSREYVTVEFTLTAGNPWLYKDPQICLPTTAISECSYGACSDICDFLSGAGEAPCCSVDPPKRGVLGGIFTIYSSTGFGEIQLESRANCTDSVPLLALRISAIPVNTTVVVDSAKHAITVTDGAGKVTDGQYLIALDPGQTIQWIEIADCESAVCICAKPVGGSPGHTATVQVSTQLREG